MAAPCRRMASRSLLQFVTCFGRTAAGKPIFRQFSGSPVCRATLQTNVLTERAASPWKLTAAVCLMRLPVISADCSPIEQQFTAMLREIELEKSLVGDHEVRLLEDAERMSRRKTANYDSDEEDDPRHQETLLAQDLEDSWEQKLKNFEPAPRVRGDVDKDLTSVERCLADSLVLLAEQQVGNAKMWLLPQTQWQEGETLRQTAERALASLPAAGFKATFLGNAPCGVYKYKLPKALRTEEGPIGTKIFFFKAFLSDSGRSAAPNASFLWLKKSELQRYLKPSYMMKVERFVLDL
ncbi:hypothetical protein PAMP_000873 [Pampus punctatissimus]